MVPPSEGPGHTWNRDGRRAQPWNRRLWRLATRCGRSSSAPRRSGRRRPWNSRPASPDFRRASPRRCSPQRRRRTHDGHPAEVLLAQAPPRDPRRFPGGFGRIEGRGDAADRARHRKKPPESFLRVNPPLLSFPSRQQHRLGCSPWLRCGSQPGGLRSTRSGRAEPAHSNAQAGWDPLQDRRAGLRSAPAPASPRPPPVSGGRTRSPRLAITAMILFSSRPAPSATSSTG